jgi:probable DNA metabolism protein
MLIFVYDGNFNGLLTAIFEAYYSGVCPEKILSCNNLQYSFLDEYRYIETDSKKAEKVCRSIESKISAYALQRAYYVFLADCTDAGTIIFNYLRLGWKMGANVDLCLADDKVLKVHEISRKVEFEFHRMLGLVRFSLAQDGIYYASISPDNNIIELLAPHFAERMPGQCWIIHDVRRGVAAMCNKGSWLIANCFEGDGLEPSDEEIENRRLWRSFYKAVEIKSRENHKLQKKMMPQRYWRHLTEKQL